MSAFFPTPFPKGFRLINGDTLNKSGLCYPLENNITATPGGNQATGYQLSAQVNRLTTVTTNGDSVVLPKAQPTQFGALIVVVINDGAANAQVYGLGADTIDAVASGTGVTVSAGRRSEFFCVASGLWQSAGMAKST